MGRRVDRAEVGAERGSGNDRPPALGANIDECPALPGLSLGSSARPPCPAGPGRPGQRVALENPAKELPGERETEEERETPRAIYLSAPA